MSTPEPPPPQGNLKAPIVTPLPAAAWGVVFAGALLAGLVAFGLGELPAAQFQPQTSPMRTQGGIVMAVSPDEEARVDRLNAALAAAVLGGLLGLALGVAAGLVRRAPLPGLASGFLGGVLGAALGFAAASVLLPIYFHKLAHEPEQLLNDLLTPVLVRSGTWAAIGAAAGLALGVGLDRWHRLASCITSGLVGGVIGAFLYEVVGALLFASAKTSQPIANRWPPRLVGYLLAATFIALLAGWGAAPSRRPPRRRAEGASTTPS